MQKATTTCAGELLCMELILPGPIFDAAGAILSDGTKPLVRCAPWAGDTRSCIVVV
jgi:hypothetical protein